MVVLKDSFDLLDSVCIVDDGVGVGCMNLVGLVDLQCGGVACVNGQVQRMEGWDWGGDEGGGSMRSNKYE